MYFEKISFEQWEKDFIKIFPMATKEQIKESYNNIRLPETSTSSSAGHDFFLPFGGKWYNQQDNFTIPTGIRWVPETEFDKNTVMLICPRSGWGTKFGMKLINTIGVIDSDYYLAKNEGHIMAIISVDTTFDTFSGDKFMQGIIVPFVRCGKASNKQRTGGFGSTDKE